MTSTVLTSSDIGTILRNVGPDALLDELIETLRSGFSQLDSKTALIPSRTGLHYSDPDLGLLEWMPASIGNGLATLKIVGYHPSNPIKRNLPTILSTLCVLNTRSGHLYGLLDGTFCTAMRTGAMSALATELLAGLGNEGVLGIIGCGAQAVTQCHALSRVIPIQRIVAYDRDPETAATFARRVAFLGIHVEIVPQSRLSQLLKTADVLCTCTSEEPGKGPLFGDFKNKPWLHINAIGSDFPGKIELPIELLRRSFVCPDFREQALVEGECQQLNPSDVLTDLSTLLRSPELSEGNREQLSVFDSTGHAFADYLAGLLILKYARALELGTELEIECCPQDPKDPYSFLNDPRLLEHQEAVQARSTC